MSDPHLDSPPRPEPEPHPDGPIDGDMRAPAPRNGEAADVTEADMEGSCADHPVVRSEDERTDEGLEETFPASDPVSAKHIT
jgi:hypothetical protein